ncbi:hypothetical protein N665_0192s0010 [Sinapis alba]|nr:hypothetical protein N665_0192s0010 [Sinapis alba]
MEPNKVRVQEVTLLYYSVRDLVELDDKIFLPPVGDQRVNLGAIFAEHLATLKDKPFKGTGPKKETIGSLLTPILSFLGISFDGASVVSELRFMDDSHLTRTQWLKEGKYWSFVDVEGPRMIALPVPEVTDFADDPERLDFRPAEQHLHTAPLRVRRRGGLRPSHPVAAAAAPEPTQPQPPLPPFPDIPEIPIHDHGDFQRVVVDVLRAIWTRVETMSRCQCFSRPRTRARSPPRAAPQPQQPDMDTSDEE